MIKTLGISAACICFALYIGSIATRADDMDKIRNALDAFHNQQPSVCPRGPKWALLELNIYCKDTCDKIATCNESHQDLTPCRGSAWNSDECKDFHRRSQKCFNDLVANNKLILEYNSLVDHCERPGNDNRAEEQKQKLRQEAEEAKKKKEDDEAIAKIRADQARQELKADITKNEQEKQALQQAEQGRTWPCKSAISACEDYVADPSARPEAVGQCRLYCEKLKSTACDSRSYDLHSLAQICRMRATADRLSSVDGRQRVVDRMKREQWRLDQERAREDEERRRQNAANAINALLRGFANQYVPPPAPPPTYNTINIPQRMPPSVPMPQTIVPPQIYTPATKPPPSTAPTNNRPIDWAPARTY